MLDLTQITRQTLHTQPYEWTVVNNLFTPADAAALAASFPRDHFKTVIGYGGEKDYEYEARELIRMDAGCISHAAELSEPWKQLARDLCSPDYRTAMSQLSGRDLTAVPMEANVFHYGPGANLGPHPDLADKLVTHILYFNRTWDRRQGGCLHILRSADPKAVATEVEPIVGNSAVLVRSDNSWHAVSRVKDGCQLSRRSMTVTFYRPGSVSSMWPPGDATPLHHYDDMDPAMSRRRANFWERFKRRFASR